MMEENIRIIQYRSEYADAFRQLNLDWIKKYFVVEPEDSKMLNEPQHYIIEKGGFIVFAKYKNDIVGTCALIKQNNNIYELAKMAVSENMQGKQIGYKIGLEIISIAKQNNAEKIILETNSSLKTAIHLYEKLGFVHIPITQEQKDRYQRADVMMELILKI
jgi:N-acetylglutamate synthase-like GNAT family acetyltransferase